MIQQGIDVDQLQKAIEWSVKQLGTPRQKRVDFLHLRSEQHAKPKFRISDEIALIPTTKLLNHLASKKG